MYMYLAFFSLSMYVCVVSIHEHWYHWPFAAGKELREPFLEGNATTQPLPQVDSLSSSNCEGEMDYSIISEQEVAATAQRPAALRRGREGYVSFAHIQVSACVHFPYMYFTL